MRLDNFVLEEYNIFNLEHRSVITEINNDNTASKYLGDLFFMIHNTHQRYENNRIDTVYIAYYNEEAIGFISINILNNSPYISYGLLNSYQHQHMAALLLNDFTEKIFEIYGFKDLNLVINNGNIASIKTAELVGYKKKSLTKYTIVNYN